MLSLFHMCFLLGVHWLLMTIQLLPTVLSFCSYVRTSGAVPSKFFFKGGLSQNELKRLFRLYNENKNVRI